MRNADWIAVVLGAGVIAAVASTRRRSTFSPSGPTPIGPTPPGPPSPPGPLTPPGPTPPPNPSSPTANLPLLSVIDVSDVVVSRAGPFTREIVFDGSNRTIIAKDPPGFLTGWSYTLQPEARDDVYFTGLNRKDGVYEVFENEIRRVATRGTGP